MVELLSDTQRVLRSNLRFDLGLVACLTLAAPRLRSERILHGSRA